MSAKPAVARWQSLADKAERATGVPANVLLGLVDVESAGVEGRTSSAGARGLTQFTPPTAQTYRVDTRPGHGESQILGAAIYLKALGFGKDPETALAKYNAGPNARPGVLAAAKATYAKEVLSRSAFYKGAGGKSSAPATSASSSSSSVTKPTGPWALHQLLGAALIIGGVGLALVGGARMFGIKGSTVAKAALVAVPK